MPDPRDPFTGEFLPPGPLKLAEHQRRLINEALSRRSDGTLKYSTVIYSAPKKSGKSALSAAIVLYFAYHRSNSFVYCLANDGKQSADRLYGPIHKNFSLHRQLGGIFSDINPNKLDTTLPNGTKIEAIPCDATGEAGSQPLFTAWSEIWGFTSDAQHRLWTEFTIPSTLYGQAMQWVESYAGFRGESDLLEQLYQTAVKEGQPHPDFLDMAEEGDPVVWTNEAAEMFCYWDHTPRMIWQSPGYYHKQQKKLSASEFDRVHRNLWVSPLTTFVREEWWKACMKDLPPLVDRSTPVVLGVDAAISNDCAALVAVTRDPDNTDQPAVRACRIFAPPAGGGNIDLEKTVGDTIREWCKKWNVVCVAYDPYQMENLIQNLRRLGIAWFYKFGQQTARAVADKALHDMIVSRTITWDSDGEGMPDRGTEIPSLYRHVIEAGKEELDRVMRLKKITDALKIDGAVALSMAASRCKELNITNRENNEHDLLKRLQRGQITEAEFSEMIKKRQTSG